MREPLSAGSLVYCPVTRTVPAHSETAVRHVSKALTKKFPATIKGAGRVKANPLENGAQGHYPPWSCCTVLDP